MVSWCELVHIVKQVGHRYMDIHCHAFAREKIKISAQSKENGVDDAHEAFLITLAVCTLISVLVNDRRRVNVVCQWDVSVDMWGDVWAVST